HVNHRSDRKLSISSEKFIPERKNSRRENLINMVMTLYRTPARSPLLFITLMDCIKSWQHENGDLDREIQTRLQ
ncbi:Hypothetical predicted protein, partial [Paramuricea clavata]